jgi:hypothetical protein
VRQQAALNNNDLAPATVGAAASPTAVYNSSNKTVTLSNGTSTVSGNAVVWGSWKEKNLCGNSTVQVRQIVPSL